MKRIPTTLITGIVLAATLMTVYLVEFPHIIYFHEQHHLFLFSWDYVTHMAHYRNTWFYPLTEFVVQFGRYTWLGAAAWTLILVSIYWMLHRAWHLLSGMRDALHLTAIVPVWLFFKTVNVDIFPTDVMRWWAGSVAVLIVALAVGRLLPWNRKRLRESESADESADDKPEQKPAAHKHRPMWLLVLSLLPLLYMICAYQVWITHGTQNFPDGKVRHLTREERLKVIESERMMILTEQAVKVHNWEEVLRRCDEWGQLSRRNHLMSYFRAIALAQTNQMYDHILDQPQTFGVESLFFPWKGDKNQAEYGHYVFEHMGQINEAQRWLFEAFVGWGETAPLLRQMARYNIAMQRPAVADKFIGKLEKSLFYRGEAARLRSYLEADSVPGLRTPLRDASQSPARWTNVQNVVAEAKYVLGYDPDNTVAQQYLMTGLLLANNLGAFMHNLPIVCPPSKSLPRLFEQALCMWRVYAGPESIARMGYTISPEVEQQFRDYMMQENRGQAAQFTPEMRRTYWYYVRHINPQGAQINV